MSQRYRIDIEYDGSNYHGWQRQKALPGQGELATIQKAVEQAIESYAQERVSLVAAGRTDAGVHALGQVAHFDLSKSRPSEEIAAALNFYLCRAGHNIAVLAAEPVLPDFSARFNAKKRHYLYRIIQRRAPLILQAKRAWHVPVALNVPLMQMAAQILVGKHDFSSFRAAQCQASSPVRTIDSIELARRGEGLIEMRVAAQSFLHNQIRAIMGSLYNIGIGRWTRADLAQALAARSRACAGQNAPPYGLYLKKIEY